MRPVNSLSVLVVDDSPFFASMLASQLESEYGMTVLTATNAADALTNLNQQSVDCVVSDYEMPETSGLELYEKVDERFDIPYILLTSRGNEEVASRAIQMGIDEYILKRSVNEEEQLDILTNRIRNVVEQHQTVRKYEQLVDNSPDEIVQLDVDGDILAANEAMATEFGVSQDELVGQHFSEWLPDEIAASRLEQGRRAVTAGSAMTFQDNIGVRHFHNIAVPLSTAGERDTIQLVIREITHQKHSEQKLERKSEKLAIINRIVRHDINNDIQLLIAWATRLEEYVDDEGVEYVERIVDTSDHIAELTASARTFVESLEGESELFLEPTELGTVLEAEVEKAQARFDDAHIVVENLPDVLIRANELLSSVFGNLLSNAVRHNDSTEPEICVDVTQTAASVNVRVADNGPGVPDNQKREIFGKGSMGPESPGTGVGLYLVHTLVDQYGGQVWVEDNDPAGAAFVVELPKATRYLST